MLRGRAYGTLSEDALERLLDTMDQVWASMSETDRAAADAEAENLAGCVAPEDLQLVDCHVAPGSGGSPRRAA